MQLSSNFRRVLTAVACATAVASTAQATAQCSTDEVGYASVEDRVSIQDWHATILHLLGMNHEELVFERNGLGERLTHQHETRVVHDILA